jgi:hypothetical protein
VSSEFYPPDGSNNASPPEFVPGVNGADEANTGEQVPWYLTAEYRLLDRTGLPASASALSTAINRITPENRGLYLELGSQLCRTRKDLFNLLTLRDSEFARRFLTVSDEEFERVHYEMQQQEETLRRRVWNLVKQLRYMQRSAIQGTHQPLAEWEESDGPIL